MAETAAARYPAPRLRRFAADVLAACGVPANDAAVAAELIVRADVRGVETHGLVRLPMYVDRLREGGLIADAPMRFVSERGVTAVLDAAGGLGHVAARRAMDKAVELAAGAGVGVVTVRRSGHFGAADGYATLAAEQGQIGVVTTNAPPALPPTGGLTAMFGTNPLALAVPAGAHGPIVMDFALTAVARGRIRKAQATGDRIPPTWATDQHGRPTDDPAEALRGLLLPIGGHKGYGLALAVDVLAGVLSGAASAAAVTPPQDASRPQDVGHFMMALNVEHFVPLAEFTGRIDELIDAVHASQPAAGVDRIYVPGEIEAEQERERTADGVPVAAHVVADLERMARSCGVAMPEPVG